MKAKKIKQVTDNKESTDLQHLHDQCKKWHSTLLFYKEEIKFLQCLLHQQTPYFYEKERMSVLAPLANLLTITLNATLKRLEKEVQLYESQLAFFIQSPRLKEAKSYCEKHAQIEKEMVAFVTQFRKAKLDFFQLTEPVLKNEKKHRLSSFSPVDLEPIIIF